MKTNTNLNKNFLNNLKLQQNIIISTYENVEDKKELLSTKIPDYNCDNWDNIKHDLDELPQYTSLYLKRLEATKPNLLSSSKLKWPKVHICQNILDLKGKVSIYYNFLERANNFWVNL